MAKSRKSSRTGLGVGSSRELLTCALHGLEQEIESTRARLQELEAQARRLRSSARGPAAAASEGQSAAAANPKRARKRRKLSADARRRIAEAQKRRWAKARAAKE